MGHIRTIRKNFRRKTSQNIGCIKIHTHTYTKMGRQHGYSEEDYVKARKESIKADRIKATGNSPAGSHSSIVAGVPPKMIKEKSFSHRIRTRMAKLFGTAPAK